MKLPSRLLIVEDDERLAELISSYFSRTGFDVSVVADGQCREMRSFYAGKILILTASSSDIDQVVGFETGADDYVIKPVEPRVLLARVNSLLKRRAFDRQKNTSVLVFGSIKLDNQAKTVEYKNNLINLTSHEFELLYLLAENAGSVLTRDDIYTRLRGFGYDGTDRAVDIKISRLRKKLDDDANEPQRIKTIWGKGYLFVPSAWSG